MYPFLDKENCIENQFEKLIVFNVSFPKRNFQMAWLPVGISEEGCKNFSSFDNLPPPSKKSAQFVLFFTLLHQFFKCFHRLHGNFVLDGCLAPIAQVLKMSLHPDCRKRPNDALHSVAAIMQHRNDKSK